MYFLGSCTSHVICVQTYTHALLNVLLIVSFKNLYYFTSKNSHARRSYFVNVTRLISLILKPSIHKITCYLFSLPFFFSCSVRSKTQKPKYHNCRYQAFEVYIAFYVWKEFLYYKNCCYVNSTFTIFSLVAAMPYTKLNDN